jgi:mRNA interferase MazF
MYSQRDIILIPFPFSDLTGSKKRPAIIISNSKLKGDDFICSLITSNKPKKGMALENKKFEEGKLPFKSWIKPERIFTIDKRIIIKKLAKIKPEIMIELKSEVEEFISLEK